MLQKLPCDSKVRLEWRATDLHYSQHTEIKINSESNKKLFSERSTGMVLEPQREIPPMDGSSFAEQV